MPSKPQSVQQLISQNSHLYSLQKSIQQQQAILSLVKSHLPAGLASHCWNAGIQRSQLILTVDTSVWASKLRFLTPQLLSTLRKQHPGIAGIKVRCAPQQQIKPLKTARPADKRPSAKAGDFIAQSATHFRHEALKAALQRLAKTLKH